MPLGVTKKLKKKKTAALFEVDSFILSTSATSVHCLSGYSSSSSAFIFPRVEPEDSRLLGDLKQENAAENLDPHVHMHTGLFLTSIHT